MRSAALLLVVLCLTTPAKGQELDWVGLIGNMPFPPGTPGGDLPAPFDEAQLLAVSPSGDLALAGTFQSQADFDMGPGSFVLETATELGMEAFVTRATADGDFVWARQFDATGNLLLRDLAMAPSGEVTLVGRFYGTLDLDPGPGTLEVSAVEYSPFVVRLDADGNLAWGAHFEASALSTGQSLALAPDGSVYVGGGFAGVIDFDPGPGVSLRLSVGDTDAYIAKLDATGELVSVWTFGGSSSESVSHMQLGQADSLWIGGSFDGTVDMDPGSGTTELTSNGAGEIYISHLDRHGDLLSTLSFGGFQGELLESFDVDSDGNVLATGSFRGVADFDPGPGTLTLSAGGGFDYDTFVVKIGPDGNGLWVAQLAAGQGALGLDSTIDADGNVYVTGVVNPPADFDPGPGELIYDPVGWPGYVWKLDTDGNLVYVFYFNSLSVHAEGIELDAAGNIYVAGSFYGLGDFDPGPSTSSEWIPSWYVDGYVARFQQTEPADWPGAVADGSAPGESPLRLALEPDGRVRLEWEAACLAEDHAVAVGDLVTLFTTGEYAHNPNATVCTTEGATTATIETYGLDLYLLVVPNDGTVEGSYGKDSAGQLRPPGQSPCYPRGIGSCRN